MENSKLSSLNFSQKGNELKNQVSVNFPFYLTHNNIYYCSGNVIVDFNKRLIRNYPEHIIFADNFLINTRTHKITNYDNSYKDGFLDSVKDIERIDVKNNTISIIKKNDKIKNPADRTAVIKLKNNRITSFVDKSLLECGDFFMYLNQSLEELKLPKLQKCGDFFLAKNSTLTGPKSDLSSLEQCGVCFFYQNDDLKNSIVDKAGFVDDDELDPEYWWQRI